MTRDEALELLRQHLKNKNLVDEFRSEGGFWKVFADGVKAIKVREGQITVRLRE